MIAFNSVSKSPITSARNLEPENPIQGDLPGELVVQLALFALSRGLSMEQVTEASGIRQEELAIPKKRYPNDASVKLWLLLQDSFPGRAMTLEMASVHSPRAFSTLALGLGFAKNLRQVLDLLMRYAKLVLSTSVLVELTHDAQGREVFKVFNPEMHAIDQGAMAEMRIASTIRYLTEDLGMENPLAAIHFGHPPFGPIEQYEEFFDAPVFFDDEGWNRLHYRQGALDEPLPESNATLFGFVKERLKLANKRLLAGDVLDEVRDAIEVTAARGDYSVSGLSRELGMSQRSLQRQVAEQGATVKELLDEARITRAREMLHDPTSSIEQIADELGYASRNSFRRAFKRITGQSPSQYRRSFKA